MIKASLWKGEDLKGDWIFSYKIDGVRMLRDDEGNPVSRSNKPLYNLEEVPEYITDAEIFLNNWEDSVSLVRTQSGGKKVPKDCVYSLDPLDPRLLIDLFEDPTVHEIELQLKRALFHNFEGLMLRKVVGGTSEKPKWLKVKPKETYDVVVTGIQPGTGKHDGRMGALLTDMGKVGTGFTDAIREELNDESIIGQTIEVECMSLTPSGKFRHPRFIRVRWDKDE